MTLATSTSEALALTGHFKTKVLRISFNSQWELKLAGPYFKVLIEFSKDQACMVAKGPAQTRLDLSKSQDESTTVLVVVVQKKLSGVFIALQDLFAVSRHLGHAGVDPVGIRTRC